MSDGPESSEQPLAPTPRTALLGAAIPADSRLPPEHTRSPYRSMTGPERSALWRQRLHEAEAGLTRFLVSLGDDVKLTEWFALQAELFTDLPEPKASPQDWQRVFFRGQALMERFLVDNYGEDILTEWARANAEVHRHVEPDHGRGAADPIHRIARQAELYGSDYEFDDTPPSAARAALTITHCAIWDYREKARRSGIRLTLASPCTYCTEALSANIRAKGYHPTHRLRSGPTGHGCRWEATAAHGAQQPDPQPPPQPADTEEPREA